MALAVPNGGVLVDCELKGEAALQAAEKAQGLREVELGSCAVSDLLMMATGVLSPLCGFMDRLQYEAVVESMRLPSSELLGLPVTLPIRQNEAEGLRLGEEVALVSAGTALGLMRIEDIYSYDKRREALAVFGTQDVAHPGVARLLRQPDMLVGGPVTLFRRPHSPFAVYEKTPKELRNEFELRGWQSVVGFQTRNPIHRAHEYIQKCALEMVDGLLLHPLVGETKPDDISPAVRFRSYEVMLADYYPVHRVILAAFPAAMRYAGPREAIFHAMCRRNYGCTHFIVGRDHAGVGSYYGTYAAQQIFSQFQPAELGIQPLMFEHAFFCHLCNQMGSLKTCPHSTDHHVSLSGSKVRAMLQANQAPPPEITRPEVAAVLMAADG
ncbi:MAG: sulfate adenylyltransferase [Limnochordia bacterium]|jgi:sulfate adenylyltransferase